jgi:hypothetical protein
LSPSDVLAMRLLHGVARIALRLQPPAKARRTVEHCARWVPWVPRFEGFDVARAAARALARTGSCLSRSLTVASRLPGAEVVIGADPRWSGAFTAHAWVEWKDQVVDASGVTKRGEPLARL